MSEPKAKELFLTLALCDPIAASKGCVSPLGGSSSQQTQQHNH